MPLTPSLLSKLVVDFPQFTFEKADRFSWSPDSNTLYVDESSPDFATFALHELGHALLAHTSYSRDIELIKIEREAWQYALDSLADRYDVAMPEDHIQDNLDTYREWLHTRSLCPSCSMTGLQTAQAGYSCLACGHRWRPNEARSCALRRYSSSTKIPL